MSSFNDFYQFGEYELKVRTRVVSYRGAAVPFEPKTFEVLLYLVANAGRVVTKEELLKAVWPDSFVEESNLTQHVFRLRKALRPQEGDEPYIVTVPGQGYQFSAEVKSPAPLATIEPGTLEAQEEIVVQRIRERSTVVTEEIIHQPPAQLARHVPKTPRWRIAAVSFASAIALAALGIWGWYATHHSTSAASASAPSVPATRRSIAVLGFRNLSGRPEEAWLSTAIAEMLSTELVAGEKLRLVSGEDVARTKLDLPVVDTDSLSRNTLARLHKELDSDWIVLGSYTALVGQPGTRIRLDVHVQDTSAGETIADVAVVGSEADLFDLVSQAGSGLRAKLGVEAVSPVEAVSVRAALPSNREAARLYSEGLARLRVFDALAARDLLEAAIAADPKYSLAHSGLAEAWSRLGYDKRAREEAQRAYELAANLSREEKLVVEGRYRDIDHEYDKAIEIYRSLFVLFPDNLDYGLRLAAVQVRGGKGHDALATVESLRKLTPPASQHPLIDLQEAAAWEELGDIKRQQEPLARAVELARQQGSRLILARARNNQCVMFSYLEQPQNAIAACRESRDIYAAAGNGYGEANSLANWADAIGDRDAPEAIRLYQQAQTAYRQVGCESGVASMLNNIGIVYGAQGDLAVAEKMYRQALESFRLLDNKRSEARVTGNVADERMAQGDLPGAIQLYQAALQLDRETADTGSATMIGYDLAVVHQLQGDLAGAKQEINDALQAWQKSGDRNASAYGTSRLGNLLLQEGDLAGARRMYEQALAIRTAAGDQLTMAETQLGLADLSLEEARSPMEQEASMRQAIEVFQKQKARDDEIQAWCILARALLAQDKAAAAADAIEHARPLAGKSQNPEVRWRTAIAAARLYVAGKDNAHTALRTPAQKELNDVVRKSKELGYLGIELDARLALAEIEMKEGQTATGRAHLAAIESDAKAKGYHLVTRKAARVHG
jgi:DNA-binding winged helix-turn-helix (wHTH) protein/tetratricopeptide (TPR) repeat protein/TolB-like protein